MWVIDDGFCFFLFCGSVDFGVTLVGVFGSYFVGGCFIGEFSSWGLAVGGCGCDTCFLVLLCMIARLVR